ncbi:MAG: hypothetical protein ACYTEQ_03815 [Planctomycetota bacterium]
MIRTSRRWGGRAITGAAFSFIACISAALTFCGCGQTTNTGRNTDLIVPENKSGLEDVSAIQDTRMNTGRNTKPVVSENDSGFQEKWGVQIVGIRLSAADYMLDFRYRVVDPNKAAPLLSRKVKPYLVDEASGAKLIVPAPPKVGSLRQKSYEPIAGKIYFIIFSNPGKLVKRGGRVTVVIGDFKAENLIVE